MSVIHRLVGYDLATDRMREQHDIPFGLLREAFAIAQIGHDDPDAAWSYALTPRQAQRLASLIGAEIAVDAAEFFLEPFATPARDEAAA